jgi:hypothetical protein
MALKINKEMNTSIVYKADLQRIGSLVNESVMALAEYAKFKDWEKTKETIVSRNLLAKRSSQTLKGILKAIEKRFLTNYEALPSCDVLAEAIAKNMSKTIKVQLLYPYICESDLLIKNLLLNLVTEKMHYSSILTKNDVLEFLENEKRNHPELREWSDYLKRRWTRGFLAFLRDFAIMDKAPSNRLLKPLIRVESFTFFMLGLLEKRLSPNEIFHSEVWKLYFLRANDLENLLIDAQAQGWVNYSKAGDIIELRSKYQLKRWLDECF